MSDINLVTACVYERALITTLFKPLARLAVGANPLPNEAIPDLSCGNGIGLWLISSLVGATGKLISLGNDPAIAIVAKKLFKKIDDKDK